MGAVAQSSPSSLPAPAQRDLVVVGASAGGVQALRDLVSVLPAKLPAAVLVVLHLPAQGGSALPAILSRAGALPARAAQDGESIQRGRIYVAPPDFHLAVVGGKLALTRGPRENGHRPAVDVLFRTAAQSMGPRVIGVVLSGALDDGTSGMLAIAARGGVTVAQDLHEALYPAMPRSVVDHVAPDHVLSAGAIGSLLAQRCRETVDISAVPSVRSQLRLESAMAEMDRGTVTSEGPTGGPSGLTCPDCAGTLYEMEAGDLLRFRCRVGHAWSAESLAVEQGLAFESALWMAMRSLEEKAALGRQLAETARGRGTTLSAERFHVMSEEAAGAAGLIHDLLSRVDIRLLGTPTGEPPPAKHTCSNAGDGSPETAAE
ncbi:MAG: chemotaxis protein CheB [Pseudonocardiales bacterium]|nr:MAG: chemotaxis protein CheB [Pseudonocardiales bacterium]